MTGTHSVVPFVTFGDIFCSLVVKNSELQALSSFTQLLESNRLLDSMGVVFNNQLTPGSLVKMTNILYIRLCHQIGGIISQKLRQLIIELPLYRIWLISCISIPASGVCRMGLRMLKAGFLSCTNTTGFKKW